MALPKQVQRQAEEAQKLEEDLAKANTPPAADPPPQDPPQDPPPADPPADPPVPPVEPTPPADPQKPTQSKDTDPNSETWQKRYRDLQGKYNAEVPRLAQQLRELSANFEAAQTQLKELTEKPAPTPAASTSPLVTSKDIETFGGDLVDLIKRQAQEIVSERESALTTKLAKVEAENQSLRQQLGSVTDRQVVTDRRSYLSELKKAVPNWEAVNSNDDFLAWLTEVDPLTGVQRQQYLDDAFQKFDVERTSNIFNSWKAMTNFDAPPPPPAPVTPPKALERQVAPSGNRAPSAPAGDAPNQKIWTDAEIRQFHTDCIQGRYRGKDAEKQAIENEIDLAIAQGRYRP